MSLAPVDIRRAADLLGGQVVRTPCLYAQILSEMSGAELWLKFENQQFTGSFKDRGALVKLLSLAAEERQRGVVAMSAGNHAAAVAWHAQRLGIAATIVMPVHTPNLKIEHTRHFGARVELFGETLAEARSHAEAIAARAGCSLIHPYDDERIIAGQGTVALEMLADCPDLEALIVPVGGGGLIAGMALAAHAINPGIRIYGVQSERFPAMRQALTGEEAKCGGRTIAEGIAVKQPGRLTLPVIREHLHQILLVSEVQIEEAVQLLLEVEKTVVEGAGAAPLAALLAHREHFAGKRVGIVLSGGNIDLFTLAFLIRRGLVRSCHLARLHIVLSDESGALAAATALLAAERANIIEVHHQRTFSHLPLEQAEVEFTIQTLGRDHLRTILAKLAAAGMPTRSDPSP